MTLTKGEAVVRVPCPEGCACDASMIPAGTEGIVGVGVSEGNTWRRTHTSIGDKGKMKMEYNYAVQWDYKGRKHNWWTMAHALSNTDPNFPDSVWID